MALEFKLPELGENIESGDITNLLVAVGDAVSEGQSVLEIEAGKASMEIPAPVSGTVSALHVGQGDTVSVGQLVMEIESGAAAPAAPEAPEEEPAAEAAPAPAAEPAPEAAPAASTAGGTVEFKLPDLGENIESGDVTSLLVAVGDAVSEGQSIFEIEAGKASMEIPAPVSGTVSAVHVAQGDTVSVGQLVMEFSAGAAAPAVPAPAPAPAPKKEAPAVVEPASKPAPAPAPAPALSSAASAKEEPAPAPAPAAASQPDNQKAKAVSASPSVRRLARELGVDIHRVPATGPAGHIVAEDVKEFAKVSMQSGAPMGFAGETRVEKMSAVRKATMKHMIHCWTTIPHVTQQDTADITKLELLRKQYAPRAEAVGAKLTMTAIIIKVIASALKKHPAFNCSINPEKAEIIYKDYYNIGIAMDTPKGLLVPVITDSDKKNFVELAQELGALGAKAKEGKLAAGDLKGGTFTFTNLGGIGGTFFTPIINSPEVAILGCGRAYWESNPEGGEKQFKLPLSLSYDHRIIDGANGARFLRWIVEAMQEPMILSLEG